MVKHYYNQPSSTLTINGKTYGFGDECDDPEVIEKYAHNLRVEGPPDKPKKPKKAEGEEE